MKCELGTYLKVASVSQIYKACLFEIWLFYKILRAGKTFKATPLNFVQYFKTGILNLCPGTTNNWLMPKYTPLAFIKNAVPQGGAELSITWGNWWGSSLSWRFENTDANGNISKFFLTSVCPYCLPLPHRNVKETQQFPEALWLKQSHMFHFAV